MTEIQIIAHLNTLRIHIDSNYLFKLNIKILFCQFSSASHCLFTKKHNLKESQLIILMENKFSSTKNPFGTNDFKLYCWMTLWIQKRRNKYIIPLWLFSFASHISDKLYVPLKTHDLNRFALEVYTHIHIDHIHMLVHICLCVCVCWLWGLQNIYLCLSKLVCVI